MEDALKVSDLGGQSFEDAKVVILVLMEDALKGECLGGC